MQADILAWLVPAAFATFSGAFLVLRLHGIGSYWWVASFGSAGLAFAATILPPPPPPFPAVKAVIEDILFLLALIFFAYGTTARFRRRPGRRVLGAILFVSTAGATVSALHGSVGREIVFVQTGCALILLEAARAMSGAQRHAGDKLLFALLLALVIGLSLQNILLAGSVSEPLTFENWRGSPWSHVFHMVSSVIGILFAVTILVSLGLDMIEKLRRFSEIDVLSGVLNRRGFEDAARSFEERATGSSAVMIVDVDRFKTINDDFGHAAGDLAIAGIGHLLETAVGRRGIVGRLGGEEFAVLLEDGDAREAHRFAEDLRRALGEIAWGPPLAGRRITASIGVSALRAGEPLADAMQRADANLYRAKRDGRDRVISGDRDESRAA
ncbi:GGDEF domain-containing protein [Aureimonas populi]|uniref:diguanylate cyclase n=1 Tax=Aureimonas populi TaxID=1701758 RepID=A0ABW5CPL2_9HYPH|nr:GGDEF domain-containing protein [Aureimonas populi]